jgi:hypothetical protein
MRHTTLDHDDDGATAVRSAGAAPGKTPATARLARAATGRSAPLAGPAPAAPSTAAPAPAPADPFGIHLLAPGDAAEVEADRAADAMVTGAPVHVTRSGPAIARKMAPTADPSGKVEAGTMEAGFGNKNLVPSWSLKGSQMDLDPIASGKVDAPLREVFETTRQTLLDKDALLAPHKNVKGVLAAIHEAQGSDKAADAQKLEAALYQVNAYALALTLNASKSPRYQMGGGKTFCNIYAHDFAAAMGGYLPTVWWASDALAAKAVKDHAAASPVLGLGDSGLVVGSDGKQVKGGGVNLKEQTANDLYTWLSTWGQSFGWESIGADMQKAQETANQGHLVIISSYREDPAGHVAIVLPERDALPGDLAGKAGVAAPKDAVAHTTDKEGDYIPVQSMAGDAPHTQTVLSGKGNPGGNTWWKGKDVKGCAYWLAHPSKSGGIATPEELGIEMEAPPPKPAPPTPINPPAPKVEPPTTPPTKPTAGTYKPDGTPW